MAVPAEIVTLAVRPEAAALAFVVGIGYPLVGWFRYQRLRALPEPLGAPVKLRLYASIVVTQWLLVLATVWVLSRAGLSLAWIGQGTGRDWRFTLGMIAVGLVGFALLSSATLPQLRRANYDELPEHVRRAGKILPGTRGLQSAFVAVALTAGICEEILYRGFLPWFVAGLTGSLAMGFVAAAIVFGLGHAYQGRNGVIATALLALFFGSLTFMTGSLVPGQVLHCAIDLVNGLAVGAAVARRPRVDPVPAPLA